MDLTRAPACALLRTALLLALIATGLVAAPAARAASSAPPRAVTLSGLLEQVHGHRADDRKSLPGWMLTTVGHRRIPLSFGAVAHPRAGSRVRIRGVRQRATLRVRSIRRLPGGTTARAATRPDGAKKTAVVLFNFSGDRSQPFTVEQVRSALFTDSRSVSAFLAAESHQQLSLTGRDRADGDVYGWFEIDSDGTECFGGSEGDWYAKADAAVAAAGGDLGGYDHVVYVHPRVSACDFAGIATLGGGWSDFNGTVALWVAGHEIGHNYGFEHAGKAYCADEGGRPVAISRNCAVGEYDDPYDIMGNRFQRSSSGVHQLQAGWLPLAALRTITADGSYELAPLGGAAGGVQVLRVRRSDGRYYWLELRRPQGVFDNFAPTESVISGVSIRLAGGLGTPGITQLIDTNPEGPTWARDEALAPGRSFVDPDEQIRITTEAAGAEGARVAVHFGPIAQDDTVSATGAPAPEPTFAPPPSPPSPPAPPPGAAAPTGDTPAPPRVERVLPRRALVNRRSLGSARLRRADGRALAVRSRAALDIRFVMGGDVQARHSRLELRMRSSRRCRVDTSIRGASGRWIAVAHPRAQLGWSTFRVALPAGALRHAFDVRVGCRGTRQTLEVDAAALTLE